MNKILVSDIIEVKDHDYLLNCQKKDLQLKVQGEVKVYFYNEDLENLDIILDDNSILNIYLFNQHHQKLKVTINQFYNSKIFFNCSLINNVKSYLEINNYLNGNNNESVINVRNISNKDLSQMQINVVVQEKTVDNIAIEDLKGINNAGLIQIEPNILCYTNEVSANHLTTIGSIPAHILNYLMSKNISEETARKIILQGFLYSNMDLEIKKLGGDINV